MNEAPPLTQTEWPMSDTKVKQPKFYKQHFTALAFDIRMMYAQLLDEQKNLPKTPESNELRAVVIITALETLEEFACRLAQRFEKERKGIDGVLPFDRELWFKACAPEGHYDDFVQMWEGYVEKQEV